ncbi:MAG: enoyl-CoA hydratase-related protein [Candidatus Binatia bacterium]
MDLADIVYESVEERIVRITLARPEKLNAMSGRLLSEFDRALDEFERDEGASVLIIRGAGRAFSAGYDLKDGGGGGAGPFTITQDRWQLRKLVARWQRLWNLPKPTIAQVHGYCLAGATELAGHCDIVFAAENAEFGHPAGRALGVIPTLSLWPYLIGIRRTKEFLFTGDSMTAAQALEYGLVNRVVPVDRLEDEVLGYARRVARVPLDMLTLHKAATNRFFELMGIYAAEQSSAELDAIAHQTATAKGEMRRMREGLKAALAERDRGFRKT